MLRIVGALCEVDEELEKYRHHPPGYLISYRICINILIEKRIEQPKNLKHRRCLHWGD